METKSNRDDWNLNRIMGALYSKKTSYEAAKVAFDESVVKIIALRDLIIQKKDILDDFNISYDFLENVDIDKLKQDKDYLQSFKISYSNLIRDIKEILLGVLD